MSDENLQQEDLVKLYIEQYAEKVFYFCLKKTGKREQAEDLTSDISLCVLMELAKGNAPNAFSAWVWRIARNRYSRWADRKRRQAEAVSGSDIGDFELADEKLVENEYVRSEEISLLRREPAFISSDHREIIVAYYIEDKPIREIAKSLGLTEGAVKMRLLRARRILKEGIDMAREFGKRSYDPEEIDFIMNGCLGNFGEPVSLYERKLVKNILLAAYDTPSTAEELSLELGVALPYMEDELKTLTESTLLCKNGDKYETNMIIVSANAQEKIYAHQKSLAPRLTKAVIELVEYKMKCKNENGSKWSEGYQSYEDAKWAFLMRAVDDVSFHMPEFCERERGDNLDENSCTIRPDKSAWDVVGLEEYKGEKVPFISWCGYKTSADKEDGFIVGQFCFERYGGTNAKYDPFSDGTAAAAIVAAARGKTGGVETEILDRLADCGYLRKENESYVPTFLVMKRENQKPLTPEQEEKHKELLDKAIEIEREHYLFCLGVVSAEVPKLLKNDEHQIKNAAGTIFMMRGAVLEEALNIGYISYDESADNRMLGTFMGI